MQNWLRNKFREYIADISLLAVALIWGSTFIIVKQALDEIPPIAFVGLRFSIAALAMSIFVIFRWKELNKKLLIDGTVLGIALFCIFVFQTLSLKYTAASVVGFLTGLYVIFVPIFSAVFLKKYPHPLSWLGVAMATAGMLFITLVDSFYLSMGEWFGIINAFFIAVHIILTDIFSRKHSPFMLTFVQITVVATFSSALSVMTEPVFLPDFSNTSIIFALLSTGLIATVLCFFIQTAMQRYTTPTKAAIMFTFEPISSAFFSFWLGAELLMMKQYMGAGLVIAAILLAEVGTYMKSKN